jgi:hypothetical protein
LTHAAELLSRSLLSRFQALRGLRSSSARTAMAAGSSIRAGSPCCSRERRASSAPALRIRTRSSVLSGARGGRRVSRRRTPGAFTSSVPGLDSARSVVGYHLPGTTRRVVIASCLLLSNAYGAVSIGTRAGANQYHDVIKKLQIALRADAAGGRCAAPHVATLPDLLTDGA